MMINWKVCETSTPRKGSVAMIKGRMYREVPGAVGIQSWSTETMGLHRLDVVLLRNPGDAEAVVGVVGPLGIHVRAEKVVGPIIPLVGLQTLKHLLAVVKHHGGGRQGEVLIGHNAGVVPTHSLGVVHDKHVVGKNPAKAQISLGLFLGGCGLVILMSNI